MENFAEIKGVNLFYEETGNPNGEPVVILHGWGCDHSTVKFIASILEKNMRVINVDLPGHGKSDEPSEIWGSADFAECIIQLIKKLGLKNPSLIGHSFGGRTSILMSVNTKINKLVLVDSAGLTPHRPLSYYYKIYSFKLAKKLLPYFVGQKKAKEYTDRLRNKRGSSDYNAASEKMRAIMSKCVNEDLREELPRINCPTLLIWGDNDTATPLSDAEAMRDLIPDSGLVSFPGCGHYSFLDNPIGFRAVVSEFLKPELSGKTVNK